ncbi:dCTP deaminase [Acinetobacter towneri]|uniref:dCTP deaminase n=1 Tax=Acinetobacter towneri TaxID=202956 RepID=UPI001CE0F6E6|nr:deoxycytidine deaminase [Acinetobacter towneri]MCA4791123.1 deoxycytidine deaminase [Acinetobacter towneri]
MILSIKSHIDEFIRTGILINVNERELNNSEGVGLDLAVDTIYEILDEEGLLGTELRRTPASMELKLEKDGYFHLLPNKSYLFSTKEHFNLPMDLCCQFFPRSTLFRSGLIFQSSILSTGYTGPMIFSITNNNQVNFLVEPGARFATAIFMQVVGETNSYRGQWNHGRVSQPIEERQV